MTALALAVAFFLSPARSDGLKPVELSGDRRADWLRYAATAEACAADELPNASILASWKKLGVRMLKRVAWDPECSPEFIRRKAGFLAIHEKADGVWLVGEENFPDSWKRALAEAKIDVDVTLYCKKLAEKAIAQRAVNHKIWIEGRRVLWFLDWMDFASENLDTLRLEFVCYAKRLEQLLGLPARDLPLVVGQPLATDCERFEPLAGRDVTHVPVAIEKRTEVKLGEGLSFRSGTSGFGFTISSSTGAKGVWPGGVGSFRMYLADGRGSYLPYEFRIDLSPVATNRAPVDAYGLWFLDERWGRGVLHLYASPRNWRLTPVARRSTGAGYPALRPRFDFRWNESGGGWSLRLDFSWLSVYGLWPSMRNGVSDHWFVSLDALPGIPATACRLDWAKGRDTNFKTLAAGITCGEITERYAAQLAQTEGVYHRWHDERLYGFAKTEKPTYQRSDAESDRVFWERVVEPMMDANRNVADITHTSTDKDNHVIPAPLERQNETVRLVVMKSLGKLFDFAERVSVARRDYILQRYAGQMPPEPPKRKPPEGVSAITAPDVDNDDDALQLDDKEF